MSFCSLSGSTKIFFICVFRMHVYKSSLCNTEELTFLFQQVIKLFPIQCCYTQYIVVEIIKWSSKTVSVCFLKAHRWRNTQMHVETMIFATCLINSTLILSSHHEISWHLAVSLPWCLSASVDTWLMFAQMWVSVNARWDCVLVHVSTHLKHTQI